MSKIVTKIFTDAQIDAAIVKVAVMQSLYSNASIILRCLLLRYGMMRRMMLMLLR